MRIASLVPSSTEMLFALGLGDSVVGVTHECDYPPEAAQRAHLTSSVIENGLPAAGIDASVRARTEAGEALYELDEELLNALAPDLVVTQAVCEVCAVSFEDVKTMTARMPSTPEVISLDPTTLGEVLGDIPRLAAAADAGPQGAELVEACARRIDAVVEAVGGAARPRVAALEWLEPVFIGGHWVPQMIELAGGDDALGFAGERSRTADWAEVHAALPDVIVSMPCGYGTDRAAGETMASHGRLAAIGARVAAVDASSYFSRPGPRLVDGIELLAHLLHPGRVEAPPPGRFTWLDVDHPMPVT